MSDEPDSTDLDAEESSYFAGARESIADYLDRSARECEGKEFLAVGIAPIGKLDFEKLRESSEAIRCAMATLGSAFIPPAKVQAVVDELVHRSRESPYAAAAGAYFDAARVVSEELLGRPIQLKKG